ncbi:MAG TPA: hypothetical protein VED01_01570 [Burkholderiales bacterium]|nr:hypothetical protein [Burkholderiales bacterium]
MHTLSARVPADDFAWLSGLDMAPAATPSDKLRALIAQMRRQHEGALDYTACIAWLRDMLSPLVAALRGVEHRHEMHSAAVTVVIEWAPQIMATLLAARSLGSDDAAAATALEKTLVQQCFQLIAALLRLGVTAKAECYTEDAIEKQLPRVLELAQLITANREPQEIRK